MAISTDRIFQAVKNITVRQLPLKEYPEVICQAIDMGVIELYKRFNLGIDSVEIQTNSDTKMYQVDDNNISFILEINDSKGRTLNRPTIEGERFDYKVIGYDKFILTNPKDDDYVTVVYKKSSPNQISYDTDNKTYSQEEIDLPLDMFGALVDFVTYRCHITLNNDNLNEVDVHYRRFESTCMDLLSNGYKQEVKESWKGSSI